MCSSPVFFSKQTRQPILESETHFKRTLKPSLCVLKKDLPPSLPSHPSLEKQWEPAQLEADDFKVDGS